MDATFLPGGDVVIVTTSPDLAVAGVVDPEIPVLTIADLGILRSVEETDGVVKVTITPTYSGCPALGQIRDDIVAVLGREGYTNVEVVVDHSVVWTTDWMTEEARDKLAGFGIAPPGQDVLCPKCSSGDSRVVAEFGSTACKALLVCSSCGEPFDHFKTF